jgi:hypothetical protein
MIGVYLDDKFLMDEKNNSPFIYFSVLFDFKGAAPCC